MTEPRSTAAKAPRNAGRAVTVATLLIAARYGSRAGTPNGFSIEFESLIGPGANAGPTVASAVPITRSQASQRQRGEGRWPSGNTAGTAAPTITIGITNTTSASQVNHAVNGQVPPVATLPAEYPPLNTPTANRVPAASSSQPMRFVGTRATRNAPTPATDAIMSVNRTVATMSNAAAG